MTNLRVDDTSAIRKKNPAVTGAPTGAFAFRGFAIVILLMSLMGVGCNNQHAENEPTETDALEIVDVLFVHFNAVAITP